VVTTAKWRRRHITLILAFFGIFLAILSQNWASAEVFSSASEMKEVFRLERELVSIMDGFASKLQTKLNKINSYLEEFDEVMKERRQSPSEEDLVEKIATNPIHAYKMMKRFTVDWKSLQKDLEEDDWEEVEFQLKKKKLGTSIPRDEDLHGAAQALIRLQDVYELDIRDLSKGDLGIGRERVITKAGLSAQDCLFMGKHCFNSGALARSLEWFEEAWVMAGQEGNRTLKQEQVQSFLDHAAKVHDTKVLKGEKSKQLFPKPVYEEAPFDQREKVIQGMRDEFHRNVTNMVKVENFDIDRFNALCRGEELRDVKYVAKLRCRLKGTDPYYKLAPIKEETVHLDPGLWIYHDIVSPKEKQDIIKTAGPFMMRSQVQGENRNRQSRVSMTRTSKTGWLQDSMHPTIGILTKRVSHVTGLRTDTFLDESELLQVANYINGGHYSPHHDYVHKQKDPNHPTKDEVRSELSEKNGLKFADFGDFWQIFIIFAQIYVEYVVGNGLKYATQKMIFKQDGAYIGDRVATWMFYLNDVASGGRTVFPRIGAGVSPEVGSAVFWYNLHDSGDPDKLTLHGACPVLYGTKWVSNKWIREGAQTFNRPCSLERKTKHDYE